MRHCRCGIDRISDILSRHFPIQPPNDVNELSNEVILMARLLSFMKSARLFLALVFAQIVVAAEFPPPNPFPLHKRLHQHTFIRT